jgi:predicted acetyltransferase
MAGAHSVDLRPIEAAEVPAFVRAAEIPFGHLPDDEEVAYWSSVTRPDQALAGFEGGRIVATALWARYELTLPPAPGAAHPVLSVPGVTAVGVHPTHRRQGLLTAMMTRQLADLRQQGHAVAILMAAESVIYGRFGYGLAQSLQAVAITTSRSVFRRPVGAPGRIRLAEPDDAAKVIPGVHDRARRLRPGELTRPAEDWDWLFRDTERERGGGGPRFYAVHESGRGEPDGYVSYRYHRTGSDGLSRHRVEIDDLLSVSPEVHAALWRFVLDLDLVGEVSCGARPLDDPMRWWLADPRQFRTTRVADQVWVRIIDPASALGARGYRAAGHLVLDVRGSDPAATGRWVLETDTSGAACRRAGPDERADLVLGLDDLGAVYLGGVSPSVLARAGRITEERAGALERADAVFTSAMAPFTSTDF